MSVFVQSQHGGTEIANPNGIRGFKAFDPDWACRPSLDIVKQYTCPGVFETETIPSVCRHGMHFCRRLEDIFDYYATRILTVNGNIEPPKVAEVIAWGIVYEDGNKCSTNKLEIVKEIPWQEVLDRVNTGHSCSGVCNVGNYNVGNCNTGDWNIGSRNTGHGNVGNYNTGNYNVGDCNTGDWNTGSRNTGHCNTGDWNHTNYSAGCFCTEEPEMLMFNKPSGMTFHQWMVHPAKALLDRIPNVMAEWVRMDNMTEEEKAQYPTYKTTGGYLKVSDASESAQRWWDELSQPEQEIILQLPNFDAEIFYACTNIRV